PKTWSVVYRGPMDAARVNAAVDGLLAGGQPQLVRTALSGGQPIAFPGPAHSADFAKISYAKDVAPILQEKCVSCHIAGGIGPFAMNSYELVKGFAPMIRETVRTQR